MERSNKRPESEARGRTRGRADTQWGLQVPAGAHPVEFGRMDPVQRRAGKDLGVCDAAEQTEIGGRCESSRFSRCRFVQLCHSVGWIKEQQE